MDGSQQPASPDGPIGIPAPPPPPAATNGGAPPPPPPPPPAMPGGVLQPRRIPTELGPRAPVQRPPGEPPSVIQTAMATKDKKPFTYLPGGIDLSEIKSPRMQKRIMMNARSDGVAGGQPAGGVREEAAGAAEASQPAPPPPPPPPAAAPAPPPPQRQAVPLASILTASARPAAAQRGGLSSPVAPQPPERAQPHRPQFRSDQGAQMAPPEVSQVAAPSTAQMAAHSPLAEAPQPPARAVVSPVSAPSQEPLRFTPQPQRASPPQQQLRFSADSQPQRNASPPSAAATPPWRANRKPGAADSADGGATCAGNSGASRGQGELYIRPVPAEVESPSVQLRPAPMPWMSSPTVAEPAPEFAAAAQQIEAARLGRLGQQQQQQFQPQQPPQRQISQQRQFQQPQQQFQQPQQQFLPQQPPQRQISQQQQFQQQQQFLPQQPPQRQVSQQGTPKERIISIRLEGSPPRQTSSQQQQQQQQQQQRQQFQQPQQARPAPVRQQSTSSQRVIPVALASADDGSPHVVIGGRTIPLTGDTVTLPMGLVLAEPDRASPATGEAEPAQSKSFRLIQQVADSQTPTAATPGGAAPRPRAAMTSTDPAEDLVPCMRSVQLSDGDRQLMSAFKDKVDGETETYLHSESDPRYKGAHIPSRTFRILQAATGGPDGVSGGGAPAGARIGGPGQNRTVVVTMPTGGASGPAVPASQQEAPEPRKYTGANIPSRSFRVLQQMTADDQDS